MLLVTVLAMLVSGRTIPRSDYDIASTDWSGQRARRSPDRHYGHGRHRKRYGGGGLSGLFSGFNR